MKPKEGQVSRGNKGDIDSEKVAKIMKTVTWTRTKCMAYYPTCRIVSFQTINLSRSPELLLGHLRTIRRSVSWPNWSSELTSPRYPRKSCLMPTSLSLSRFLQDLCLYTLGTSQDPFRNDEDSWKGHRRSPYWKWIDHRSIPRSRVWLEYLVCPSTATIIWHSILGQYSFLIGLLLFR